jgi:hypothetical protein
VYMVWLYRLYSPPWPLLPQRTRNNPAPAHIRSEIGEIRNALASACTGSPKKACLSVVCSRPSAASKKKTTKKPNPLAQQRSP